MRVRLNERRDGVMANLQVDCPVCRGRGVVRCPSCSSKHTPLYDGSGKVKRGLIFPYYETCLTCNGSGRVSCNHCSGSGKVPYL